MKWIMTIVRALRDVSIVTNVSEAEMVRLVRDAQRKARPCGSY